MTLPEVTTSQEIKACCAATYGSDWARLLVGDSMHPGGVELTKRLGHRLELSSGSRVLDVASGRGASAFALSRSFGCKVTGVDLSSVCVEAARNEAFRAGLGNHVNFEIGDAESLPHHEDEFDAVICECAFCTFPDKSRAALEMARVLKPGGRLGLSDLVRRGELPPALQTLAGWIACIADARPESAYVGYLESAGLRPDEVEIHDEALIGLIRQMRGRLLGARLMTRLRKVELPGTDLDQAMVMARAAESAVRSGLLGYVLITARKALV
jgi:ubiquinone/menaquinone biosynthesis C-methylase UbiE